MPVVNRHPRPRIPPARTPETVRQEAQDHFSHIVERPMLFKLSQEDAQESARLGLLLLEAILQVAPGEHFDLGDFFEANALSDDQHKRTLALGTMPFVTSSLRLADMEFVHEAAGVLPFDVVRDLLDTKEPIPFKGMELTRENVLVKYRRRTL